MRLLVVEGRVEAGAAPPARLEEASWTVDATARLPRLAPPAADPYDLVLLDLGLPGTNGLTLLRRMRAEGMDVPVLILTARGSGGGSGVRIGRRRGRLHEQALRLRRADRAHPGLATPRSRTKLHGARGGRPPARSPQRQACRGVRRVDLTAREFSLLEFLMRHAGEVVTRTMLAEHVWGDHYDSFPI